MGFLTVAQAEELNKLDRLFPVLVRCGCNRFTCSVQYLKGMIICVEAGGDYVRDVSIPVGTEARQAAWVELGTIEAVKYQAANLKAAGLVGQVSNKSKASAPPRYHFNENDCGGVFDGNRVVSDADPGL